jgi:hypothetical protein
MRVKDISEIMSKSRIRKPVRSHTAMGMICSGTGRKQIFKDKRTHRAKDHKNSWQEDQNK